MANKIQKLTQSRAEVQRILNESDGLRQQVESELATLKGDGEGSVSAAVEAGVRRVLGGASEAYDTLKEIEEYIEKDEAGAVALAQSIAKIPFEKGSADNSAVLKNTSKKNQATYQGAVAVGEGCKAQAQCANAEGYYTEAKGFASHAEGSHTITNNNAEHAEGYWNKSKWNGGDVVGTIHSVGIGTSEDDRKNAHEILRNGKHFILGIGGYDGTNPDESTDVVTALTLRNITHAELVSLRDSGKLIPSQLYRITDYITTTTQSDTQSAGHPFDVIVLALSESELSEQAWAIQSARDTDGYFANSKLSAWKIWYSLDNDTERFAWADTTNGKGVIYRMIDEFDNDCPYDFKNIEFKVSAILSVSVGSTDIDGSFYVYTFSYFDDTSYYDHSITKYVRCNTIKTYYSGIPMTLPLNAFVANVSNKYTAYNTLLEGCTRNFFGTSAQENTLYQKCQRNTFGDSCQRNTFEQGCADNWFKHNFSNNYLERGCKSIRFSNDDTWETGINYIRNNRFKAGCSSLRFKNEETASSNSQIQNYIFNIKNDIYGRGVVRSSKGEIHIEYTAQGGIREFCLADMADTLSKITTT